MNSGLPWASGTEERQVVRRQAAGQHLDPEPRRHRRRQPGQEEQAAGAEQHAAEVAGAQLGAEPTPARAARDRRRQEQAEAKLVRAALGPRRLDRGGRVDDAGAVAIGAVLLALGLARGVLEELLDHLGVGHALADDQRGDAGDVGRRHRRALERVVAARGRVADLDRVLQDAAAVAVAGVAAGRGDVDVLAVVRVERGGLVAAGRGDRDRPRVGRGIADLVARLVAGGAHHDHALVVGVLHGLLQHPRRERSAQAHVDDLGAVVGGVADGVGDAGHRARAVAAQDLERHDLDVAGHAGDALAVVGRLRDRAGDVGAVAVVVVGVGSLSTKS
jgi:hypothetical protein